MTYEELQVITAVLESKPTRALVDSDSNCSVVTLSLVKAVKKESKIKYAVIKAKTWNNDNASFLGKVKLDFHIGNIKFKTEFLVASRLETNTGMRLGNDFLREAGCTLDYTPEKVTMHIKRGQIEIPLLYGRIKKVKNNVLRIY